MGFAKKSLDYLKLPALKSLVALGSFFFHKQPVSLNCLCQKQMFLALGPAVPERGWNACCIEITDLVLLNCRTEKDFWCALVITCGIKKNVK